jgi:sugar lactone lactonase YvrE
MRFRTIAVCAIAATIWPAIVLAEHTHYWRESDSVEFSRGTAKGVAIRSDGKLMPAPEFTQFSDPNLAYIWQLRLDSHGRLYAAGGPNAKVVRFDSAGKPTAVFESSELAAQAIAFDSHDSLYVATSPDGEVYKVTPDGQKSVFFTPKTKYIWALQMDHDGDLFIGTGDRGKVFVVRPDGTGGVFYETDQRHARSLALDAKGDLLIGTEPDGLIIRVRIERKSAQAAPTSGPAFVLYETDKKEVTSLTVDPSGNLYVAAMGEKGHAPGPMMPQVLPEQPEAIVSETTAPAGAIVVSAQQHPQAQHPPVAPLTYFASAAGGSELVRLSPDGSPKKLWSSNGDLVFATAFSPAGKLLLGTGDSGAIIQLEGNGVYSSVAQSASAQVTSLVAVPGGKMFVATANPGKVFTLGPGYARDGSFESNTFDANIFSHWGRLTWWGENGATDGKVAFYVRSGNTSSPEKNWSPWSGPYKTPADVSPVNCPPARFAQWKAVFLDTAGSPDISWVSLAYQPKNVAPVMQDVAIQDPGVRLQEFPQAQGIPGGRMNVQLRMPQSDGAVSPSPANAEEFPKPPHVEIPPQGFWDKGWQSVIWSAHDNNGDDLVFSVYYRGEGEKSWRLLKDHITQHYYSWDTTTMPDGAYYLRIVASDSPSNPPDAALTAERDSDRFEVENTPPTIEALKADPASSAVTVTFRAASAGPDALAHAKYSVDAGPWQIVYPVGLLSDAPKEDYRFELDHLAPGEHTVAVQIADRFDNTAAAKTTFTVLASSK